MEGGTERAPDDDPGGEPPEAPRFPGTPGGEGLDAPGTSRSEALACDLSANCRRREAERPRDIRRRCAPASATGSNSGIAEGPETQYEMPGAPGPRGQRRRRSPGRAREARGEPTPFPGPPG